MNKYFNSNLRSKNAEYDNISSWIESVKFQVNSVGFWHTDYKKSANYTIEDFELIFYTKGGSLTRVLNEEYQCDVNDFLFLHPKGLYTSINKRFDENEYYFFHFSIEPKIFQTELIEIIRSKPPVFKSSYPDEVHKLFKAAYSEYILKKPGYLSVLNAYLKILLVHVLKEYNIINDIVEKPVYYFSNQDSLVNEAIQFINNNIHDVITVDMIAEHFDVSVSYLYKSFMNVLHMNPSQYILENKINIAKEMVLSNAYTMETISENLGFTSLVHFSRSFKRIYGVSPKKFQTLNNKAILTKEK